MTKLPELDVSQSDQRHARDALVDELRRRRAVFGRIIDQTRGRVIKEESVPAPEKVLSIFEPHTALIVKNGAGPQYGRKLTLTVSASPLVLDCVIEQGNPGDVTVAVRQLARQKKLFGKAPHTAVFDGGYVCRTRTSTKRRRWARLEPCSARPAAA